LRKQGVLGAGHYHRHTRELFYVLEGSLILKLIPILEGGLFSYSFQKGDCFEVAPGEQHYMKFVEDTTLVVLYSEVFNTDSQDIFVDDKLPNLKELFND
jgi:quercetin dioxygenase-like cupin family protein